MKIKKIKIKADNKKYLSDISMLVDKIEFLRDVLKLREKWNITSLYKPEKIDKFLNLDIAGDKDTIEEPKEAKLRLQQFNQDIVDLRNKYNRTKNFDTVITHAVGCGVIPEHIYRTCYWDKVLISGKDNPDDPKNYQYVIVVTPRTEKKEVEEVYKEFQEHIKDKISFHEDDWVYNEATRNIIEEHAFGTVYPTADITKFRTLKEIERTREWYWMRYGKYHNGLTKKPKTYPEIIEEWNRRCPKNEEHTTDKEVKRCPYCSVQDWNVIEQAVSNFKKLLKKS